MSFSRALTYPFQNLLRVISIVLVMTIALSICLGLVVNTRDWSSVVAMLYGLDLRAADAGATTALSQAQTMGDMQPYGLATFFGAIGLLIVAVVSGFWISGYSLEVVRSIMNGIETLPVVRFGRNVKDGFYLFIAGLAYGLLFAALALVMFTFLGLTGSADGLNLIVVLASLIVTVVAVAIMGWAYLIGMARFAAAGERKASWQIFLNLRLARENWRGGAKLLLFMFALTLIYGVVRSLVDTALGGFTGSFGMASIAVSIIIYYIFNLMQHFSTQHLIAQYAIAIGIRSDYYDPEKAKHDLV